MLMSDGGTARLRPAAAAFLGASPNPNAYNYSFYSNSQPPPTQSSSPRELLQDLPTENIQQLHVRLNIEPASLNVMLLISTHNMRLHTANAAHGPGLLYAATKVIQGFAICQCLSLEHFSGVV